MLLVDLHYLRFTHIVCCHVYYYIDGAPVRQLDVSHPALTAFEIVYSWDSSAQADDVSLGITTLFIITLISLCLLCVITNYNYGNSATQTTASVILSSAASRLMPTKEKPKHQQ